MGLKDRGKLIYKMPDEIYKRIRKSDLCSRISIWAIIVLMYVASIYFLIGELMGIEGYWYGVAVLGPVGLIVTGLQLADMKNNVRLTRFKIYQNGYTPSVKPLKHLLKREEYFIYFDEIKDIEFLRDGKVCSIKLEDGTETVVSVDWEDIDGYITFLKIMKKYFPEKDYPDFERLRKEFREWRERVENSWI